MFGKLAKGLEQIASKIEDAHVDKVLDKFMGQETAGEGQKPVGGMVSLKGNNGKRRALLIGINYFGTKAELRGCLNDVKNVHNHVSGIFKDVRILTDDQKGENAPTRDNIIKAFKWLVQGAQEGDSFFLHYSGHGSRQRDEDGDEQDGFDETICPADYESAGMITDDVLNELLVQPLPAKTRLTAIFDCCHSGSMLDLPFTYSVDGNLEIKCRNNKRAAIKKGVNALKMLGRGDSQNALKEGMEALKLFSQKGETAEGDSEAQKKQLETKGSDADVLMFSGCQDVQTSADAHIDGKGCGAMSWALLKILDEHHNKPISLRDLLQELRQTLYGKFEQIPQMSTSHQVDVSSQLFSLE